MAKLDLRLVPDMTAADTLAKLKAHFPGAQVIQVSSASASPVAARTAYGTVHQIAGTDAVQCPRQEPERDPEPHDPRPPRGGGAVTT